MKRCALWAALSIAWLAPAARATLYQYVPPHEAVGHRGSIDETWGICDPALQQELATGAVIAGATLTIDRLHPLPCAAAPSFIHLLDDPAAGVCAGRGPGGAGDAFDGQGVLVASGTLAPGQSTLRIDFGALDLLGALNAALADGAPHCPLADFGFAFDLDGLRGRTGFTFQITTAPASLPDPAPVPEPATLALVAAGLGSLALRARRRQP